MSSEKKNRIDKKSWGHLLPSTDLDICIENLDLFFNTMFDRQEIWHKRFILKQDAPWTKDKIFRNNKFTNVYRELDRHSQWQINNVLLKETNRLEIIWKLMLFRIFNKPELFDFIGSVKNKSFNGKMPSYKQFDDQEFFDLVSRFRATGESPFTNAYYINSTFSKGTRDECYCFVTANMIHSNVPRINRLCLEAEDPEEIVSFFRTIPGVAQFIAHEFYQDFTYSPTYSGVYLMKFTQDDYTNVGPGASLGVRLIFPMLVGKGQEDAIHILTDIANSKLEEYGDFKYLNWNKKERKYFVTPGKGRLSLHQIEMYLCEFSKYWKMKVGLGKQRSIFSPKSK
jgi:hypothetical protein